MERIEKILKKLDKEIDADDIQKYKDCINSKLDSYLALANDKYLNAQACFGTRLSFIQQDSIENVLSAMFQDMSDMQEAEESINYINQVRDYIFEDVKSAKSVKGFKQ